MSGAPGSAAGAVGARNFCDVLEDGRAAYEAEMKRRRIKPRWDGLHYYVKLGWGEHLNHAAPLPLRADRPRAGSGT